ncbi:hypothetical protein NLI96_g5860 [Meripilus lineatus]|uniref:Uncharacterized protein n=1 Tax=Meripilus lineatus TaxID=2056292 RepID=A0AAD5V709_9APHY|nr:hypothetical protein NLI96_g5860 [Physisporinus lineatus]
MTDRTSRSNPFLPHVPQVASRSVDPVASDSREETQANVNQSPNEIPPRCSVKVRDFAYESKLPRVPPSREFPKPVDGPRPLKRARDIDFDEPGGQASYRIQSIPVSSHQNLVRSLERTDTEPVLSFTAAPQPHRPLSRQMGLAELSRLVSSQLSVHEEDPPTEPSTPTHQPPTPTVMTPNNPGMSYFEWPSQPSLQGPSQESEPWVDTPLVTPNGSMHLEHEAPSFALGIETNLTSRLQNNAFSSMTLHERVENSFPPEVSDPDVHVGLSQTSETGIQPAGLHKNLSHAQAEQLVNPRTLPGIRGRDESRMEGPFSPSTSAQTSEPVPTYNLRSRQPPPPQPSGSQQNNRRPQTRKNIPSSSSTQQDAPPPRAKRGQPKPDSSNTQPLRRSSRHRGDGAA